MQTCCVVQREVSPRVDSTEVLLVFNVRAEERIAQAPVSYIHSVLQPSIVAMARPLATKIHSRADTAPADVPTSQ
jgi:hypothetical protein